MREVAIVGSTGSIGTQALEVIASHPGIFDVVALACGGSDPQAFADQVVRFQPRFAAVADERCLDRVVALVGERAPLTTIRGGAQAVVEACAAVPDGTVLNGIAGAIGLRSTLAALASGATLALANKESLVAGGELVREAVRRPGQIVPVDSEHSAIAQALRAGVHNRGLCAPSLSGESEVDHIVLTASGGPFRGQTRADLTRVTPAQALAHPTWSMGPLVTINSSTLVNKGLELIEAVLLFDLDPAQIVPVCHPQSIVHSAVTWRDGATIAQASPPDMKLPIALGLTWPERLGEVSPPCSFRAAATWEFFPIDNETFPAIELARTAVATSPTHPAVYNAANEVAVTAFTQGRLCFLGIVDTIGEVVGRHTARSARDLADLEDIQDWARAEATRLIERKGA